MAALRDPSKADAAAGGARAPWALGVDAAGAHGWVGVVVGGSGFQSALVHRELGELVAAADARASAAGTHVGAVGVDIPIGLVDGPKRSADVAAKAFVGPRRSSVFWAPHRSAAHFTDQASANAHLGSIGMPKLSAQAMGLMGRIREAAAVAARDERIVETFPEAAFCQMGGAHLAHYKKTAAGAIARLSLLAAADPAVVLPADLGDAGAVPLDDLFDAAACAWSAWRVVHGQAVALGDPGEVDPVTGRRIAVWV